MTTPSSALHRSSADTSARRLRSLSSSTTPEDSFQRHPVQRSDLLHVFLRLSRSSSLTLKTNVRNDVDAPIAGFFRVSRARHLHRGLRNIVQFPNVPPLRPHPLEVRRSRGRLSDTQRRGSLYGAIHPDDSHYTAATQHHILHRPCKCRSPASGRLHRPHTASASLTGPKTPCRASSNFGGLAPTGGVGLLR